METLAYFDAEGNQFKPRPYARSPWTAAGINGRLLSGLIAHAMEKAHHDPVFQFTRLTTDLFRMAPMEPVEVHTTLIRSGGRIRVLDGVAKVGGVEVARASAVMLRRGTQPEGEVWSAPPWKVPNPEDGLPQIGNRLGYDPIRQTRLIHDPAARLVQKRLWMRDAGELVAGEPLTPFLRVAMLADLTNPFVNAGTKPLGFINADITLYVHRDQVGEWTGLEATDHQSADGVAVGMSALYDMAGPLGHSIVCAVADSRIQEGRRG